MGSLVSPLRVALYEVDEFRRHLYARHIAALDKHVVLITELDHLKDPDLSVDIAVVVLQHEPRVRMQHIRSLQAANRFPLIVIDSQPYNPAEFSEIIMVGHIHRDAVTLKETLRRLNDYLAG